MKAFIEGYGYGLILVILIGPVFFTLLKGTLEHGFKAGFTVALGIITGDIICVAIGLGLLGDTTFLKDPDTLFYIGIAAGIIVFILGLRYYFRPSLETGGKEIKLGASKYFSFFTQGFLVNFVNPFVFTVWFSYIALAQNRHPEYTDQVIFLVAALLGIFSTDVLKAAFAHVLKIFLRVDWLTRIYKIIGIILIVSGIGIIIRVSFFPIV